MTCYNPLIRYPEFSIGSRKYPTKFEKYSDKSQIEDARGPLDELIHIYGGIDSIPSWMRKSAEKWRPQKIPCGRCLQCRLRQAREWANRAVLEASNPIYEDNVYFVTFTYDDDYLVDPSGQKVYGEIERASLRKQDFSAYIKRLRADLAYRGMPEIRIMQCGEYGDRTHRPHYHAIFFGLVLKDLVRYKTSRAGCVLYNSPWLSSTWNKGHVVIGKAEWRSIAYVARYTLKKAYKQADDIITLDRIESLCNELDLTDAYADKMVSLGQLLEMIEAKQLQHEFWSVSNRPGIGRWYFDKHVDEIYTTDSIILPNSDGKIVKPGAYFDRLFKDLNPDQMEKIKSHRLEIADITLANELSQTDLDEIGYFEFVEREACRIDNMLVRYL